MSAPHLTIYRSFTRWPIQFCRLKDGWMLQFFCWTILRAAGTERTDP
jgi:hypothetical protein